MCYFEKGDFAMKKENFKWRIAFNGAPCDGDYFIESLPAARYLDSMYLHKPGDIDYSPLGRLSSEKKSEILYHIANHANTEDCQNCAADIAACILVDQISVPGFIPSVLNPLNW